jgi:glycosyltransferase involved in cell wall biosynthesis
MLERDSAPAVLCTIAARNYLASVVLLAESFALHHPTVPVVVLLVDGQAGDEFGGLPFTVLVPGDLRIERDEFLRMATYYDVTELSTALKPFFLRVLLERADSVMYLDPDIEVFAPLDDLFEDARRSAIVLTPHVTRPMPRDGLEIREEAILVSGQFNLGFVAVGQDAEPFLSYWEERTRRYAVRDPANGYFTDQRWVDAVPTMFEHRVVRDTACNVAYWNLHERVVTATADGGFLVDGRPLRFFHYSGHDPAQPFQISTHLIGPLRIRIDEDNDLRRVFTDRSARMTAASTRTEALPYRYARTAGGVRLDQFARRAYWSAVCEADRTGSAPPPHAFDDTGGRRFVEWLTGPVLPGNPVSRYVLGTWAQRPDLQGAFPDPIGASAQGLRRWAEDDAAFRAGADCRVRPRTFAEPAPGVNLVGYLGGGFGTAEAARLMSRLVRGTGLPLATTTLVGDASPSDAVPADGYEGAPFELSILMLNADVTAELWALPELHPHHHRTRVGVWYWEVDVLPASMRAAYGNVDEVWCASEYTREALARWGDRPVHTHPLVLERHVPTSLTRQDVGLPEDRFLFGYMFDYASVLERKNPLGLIDAYCRAFGPDDGACLVLKTLGSAAHPVAAAQVAHAAAGRDDILLIDGLLPGLVVRAMFECFDAYVSLHRSEGLGLTIAAAMAAGTPAIATGFSGNLEFMDDECSVLVPYELTDVGPGAAPYPPEAIWASPDLDAAACTMRRLFDQPDEARDLGERGRERLGRFQEHGVGAEWFLDRYETLTGTAVP